MIFFISIFRNLLKVKIERMKSQWEKHFVPAFQKKFRFSYLNKIGSVLLLRHVQKKNLFLGMFNICFCRHFE